MEITQGIVDLYRIAHTTIAPAESPEDAVEVDIMMESVSKGLPYVLVISFVTEHSFGGDYEIVSFSKVAEQHSISYIARKTLRNQCYPVVKSLFEAWKLYTRRRG